MGLRATPEHAAVSPQLVEIDCSSHGFSYAAEEDDCIMCRANQEEHTMQTRRQGDVFIRKLTKSEAARLKAHSKPIERENGRVILAHGEVTGHSHAISEAAVNFLVNEQTLQRILEIREPATLRHEEHRAFELPVGDYEVTIQREYTPAEIVNVAD